MLHYCTSLIPKIFNDFEARFINWSQLPSLCSSTCTFFCGKVRLRWNKHPYLDGRTVGISWLWCCSLNCIWKWLEFGWKCCLYTIFSTIQKFGFLALTIRGSEASENRFWTRFLNPNPTPTPNFSSLPTHLLGKRQIDTQSGRKDGQGRTGLCGLCNLSWTRLDLLYWGIVCFYLDGKNCVLAWGWL